MYSSLVRFPQFGQTKRPDLRLVPYPKQVAVKPGTFNLSSKLILQLPAKVDAPIAAQLTAELRRAGVANVEVKQQESAEHVVVLAAEATTPSRVTFPDRRAGRELHTVGHATPDPLQWH